MSIAMSYIRNVQAEKDREEIGHILGQMDLEDLKFRDELNAWDLKVDRYINILCGGAIGLLLD